MWNVMEAEYPTCDLGFRLAKPIDFGSLRQATDYVAKAITKYEVVDVWGFDRQITIVVKKPESKGKIHWTISPADD